MGSLQQFCEPTLAPAGPAVAVKTPRWYALHTRARHEKKVAVQLRDKGVSTFLPLINQVHRWSGRRTLVQLPLFSCYIFVRIVASVEARLAVLQTPGVLAFVGIRGVGIPIPEKEIEDIKTVLARETACTPHSFLKVGRRVRLRGGCFDGVEGILVGTNSDRSLVVSIELIQRSLAVRIDGYDVEAI